MVKLFGKWETEGIKVKDPGLERYVTLTPFLVPKTYGRMRKKFHKSKMNIVERLMNKLMVPGHSGKKHRLTSGRATGKTITHYNIIKKAFEIVEKKTGKNPVEVLVGAIENAAWREEITSYQVGGIIVRKAVVTSPQRRVDVALKNIVHSAYKRAFGKKVTMAEALADELIAAYNNDPSKSEAIREKERVEREAEGAR